MIRFLNKSSSIFYLLIILIILILTPFIYGSLLSNDKIGTFTGLYSMYSGEIFYYMSLGPAQVEDGFFFFEDRFDRVGPGYYFINIIGVVIYLISNVLRIDYTLSLLIYKIICALFLVYFLNKILVKINLEKKSKLLGLAMGLFTSGMSGWTSNFLVWDNVPEMNVMIGLIAEYYLPAALCMFLVSLFHLYNLLENPTKTNAIKTGIAFLMLGLVYIYSFLMLLTFCTLYFLYLHFVTKSKLYFNSILILIISSPVIIYYIWLFLFKLDDNGREDGWIDGPTSFEYLLTFFPQLILLFVFIFIVKAKFLNNRLITFSLAYIIFQFLISRFSSQYFSFVIQSYVGLSLMMIIVIIALTKYVQVTKLNKVLLFLFVMLSSYSNLKVMQSLLSSIKSKDYPTFITKDEMLVYEFINKNIAPRSKVCVCNEKARILAYYTRMFVTYDVIPDYQTGTNKKRWETLNTARSISENETLFNDLLLENYDYIMFDKKHPKCGIALDVYEKIKSSSTLIYNNERFELLLLKK